MPPVMRINERLSTIIATDGLGSKAQIEFMALEVTLTRFAMSRTIRFHSLVRPRCSNAKSIAALSQVLAKWHVRVEAIGISWYDTLWRQNLASSQARLPIGWVMDGWRGPLRWGADVDDLSVGEKVASFRMKVRTIIRCTASRSFARTALTRYRCAQTRSKQRALHPLLMPTLNMPIWRGSTRSICPGN